jgi:hypothetical protein
VRARVLLAVSAAVLLVAGCGDGDDGATTASTSTTVASATTVPVSTTAAVATTAAPAASTTTSTPAAGTVVLRPDGLGVVDFGTSKDETISALSAVLGVVDETGTGCELGGPTTTARWKELRVQFGGTGFDSYNVRPANGVDPVLGLETEAGIGVGSTVAQLQAAYGAALAIPGLPPEFGGNDFAVSFQGTDRKLLGTLSDTTDSGTVTAVFTQVCE